MKLKIKPKVLLLSLYFLATSACQTSAARLTISPQPFQSTPTLLIDATTSVSPAHHLTPSLPIPSAVVPSAVHTFPLRSTPTRTPTPPACMKQGGKVHRAVLRTDLLRQPMDYRVYTPPCYEKQTAQRYPVLYLIHGAGFSDDQWDRLGVDERMDVLVAAGEISPFIIVMPYDRYLGEPTENSFAQVIVTELIPLVDGTYRTLPQRQYRAIGGISRGAGWAIHLALRHWELFSALGAHSPTVFHTDAQQIPKLLDAMPPSAYPRILIDVGDRDFPPTLEVAKWFEELLNAHRVPHEWHLFSGFHEEAYWKAHLDFYLRWYARLW